MCRKKDVFCWNICGTWIRSLAVWGKIWPHTCSEWILETGHPPHQFSITGTKPHSNSPTFVCLQASYSKHLQPLSMLENA